MISRNKQRPNIPFFFFLLCILNDSILYYGENSTAGTENFSVFEVCPKLQNSTALYRLYVYKEI